jgi:hypothetical protein
MSWINKIKLQVNESTGVATQTVSKEADEEGNQPEPETIEGSEPYEPIRALVRVRIAKKQPEAAEEQEEGAEQPVEVKEEEIEEMPIEDRCLQVTTHNEGQNVYVINQAASRIVR